MLRVSDRQLEEFQDARLASFVEEMLVESQQCHPDILAEMSEDEARSLIRRVIVKARKNGFRIRGHLRRYIRLALTLDADFDSASWAVSILENCERIPAVRLRELERAAVFRRSSKFGL